MRQVTIGRETYRYDELATELVLRDERTEVTVLFASLAGAALLLAASFSLLWFSRLP